MSLCDGRYLVCISQSSAVRNSCIIILPHELSSASKQTNQEKISMEVVTYLTRTKAKTLRFASKIFALKIQLVFFFGTLEKRRGLEPKCAAQLFLGWLLGTRRSAIGHFSAVPSNSTKSLCER